MTALLRSTAVIAGLDDCYRYELRRVWDAGACEQ